MISGEVEDLVERRSAQVRALRSYIAEEALEAFPAVVVAEDRHTGVEALVQCHGLGAFRTNTVLAGWPRDPDHAEEFLDTLVTASKLGMSLVLLHQRTRAAERDSRVPAEGTIDVWWRGKANGHLMMMLAHLIVANEEWRGREVRLLRIVPSEAAVAETRQHLEGVLTTARISATPRVLVGSDPGPIIVRESASAAIVLLGLELPSEGDDALEFLVKRDVILSGLESALLVYSAGDAVLEA